MLAVTHTVTAAAIGSQMQHPSLAFGSALLFHLFSDTLLHWNIYMDRHRWPYAWVTLDVLAALGITYALAPAQFLVPAVLAAIIGGNLPDLWHGAIDLGNLLRGRTTRKGPFLRFHEGLQYETLNPWKGLVWQIVLAVPAMWILAHA